MGFGFGRVCGCGQRPVRVASAGLTGNIYLFYLFYYYSATPHPHSSSFLLLLLLLLLLPSCSCILLLLLLLLLLHLRIRYPLPVLRYPLPVTRYLLPLSPAPALLLRPVTALALVPGRAEIIIIRTRRLLLSGRELLSGRGYYPYAEISIRTRRLLLSGRGDYYPYAEILLSGRGDYYPAAITEEYRAIPPCSKGSTVQYRRVVQGVVPCSTVQYPPCSAPPPPSTYTAHRTAPRW